MSQSVLSSEKPAITENQISKLDDPSLYTVVSNVDTDNDPLMDVAEEILPLIDPKKNQKWADGYSTDFVEHINEIYKDYKYFWQRIPAASRYLIDLDNDGTKEYVVFSKGMNESAWGFCEFVAILKQTSTPDRNDSDNSKWSLLHVDVFQQMEIALSFDKEERSNWRESEIAIADIDRDGRSDILFTTFQIGGSASVCTMHIISMHEDMKIRKHSLSSLEPVTIIDPMGLRPVFVEHHYDDWRDDDYGVSVRSRGYRRAYHNWTVFDGFKRL